MRRDRYRRRPDARRGGHGRAVASRWDVVLVVSAGGALGSAGRWSVGEALAGAAGAFPWATFLVNATGCLALGLLMALLTDVLPPSRYLRPFLGIGVLGGFTTFSTYALETRTLLAGDRQPLAGAYVAGSLAAGLVAVWLGIILARGVVLAGRRGHLRGHHRRPPTPPGSRR